MNLKISVQDRNGNVAGMSEKTIGALGILPSVVTYDGTKTLRTKF